MKSEERALWVAGACLAIVLAGVWLTAAVASAVFGGGRLVTPSGELPSVLVHLLADPARPRDAWPRDLRQPLPGVGAFYLTAAVVAVCLGGVVYAGLRLARDLGLTEARGARERAPSARWASGRDTKDLRVPHPIAGRLTLGRIGSRLVAAGDRASVIAIAPTGGLKTTGLAIPALLEWDGPVLATSVKTDLLNDTLVRRQELGEVMVFDPAHVTGMPSARATPLWGARTWRGALRVAHWLAAAARTGSASGLQDADFWFRAAEKLLAPLLYAAGSAGLTMTSVVRWLDEGPEASETEVLALLEGPEAEDAKRAYLATQNREERQRSSVYTTAEMALGAYADPIVAEETEAADYSPTALIDGGANTLYLCGPPHEQERLRTVFSTVVQELLAIVYETVSTTGKPLDPPLLLLLDEAANIAPIPNLDEIASTGAGQGIQLLSVFQDMAQISARYGKKASTIVNNHRAKVFGSGISDPETLNYVARIAGAGEFEQRSKTAGEKGRRSTTEGDTYRDLVPPNILRGANPGSGVLLYGHLPPIRLRLRPWFLDKELRGLRDGRRPNRALKGT
jgi:type IV secretion system protein VirD4